LSTEEIEKRMIASIAAEEDAADQARKAARAKLDITG
jgi:hypothetical protein